MATETADRLLDLMRELGTLQATSGELWLLARDSASDADVRQVDDLMSHVTSSFVELRAGIERIMADELGGFVDDVLGNSQDDPQAMDVADWPDLSDDPRSRPEDWTLPDLSTKGGESIKTATNEPEADE